MSIASAIANDKLTSLRLRKKQAIQALDFDLAEELDKEIDDQNNLIISDQISKITDDILKATTQHYYRYIGTRREISDFQSAQEFQINNMFQGIYDKTQLLHDKEQKSIDKSHATALHREAEREVPEQIDLLEAAKLAAMERNYTEAKKLRSQAREVAEKELTNRKERIDEEFAQSRSLLTSRQQEAMDQINAKYDEEMNALSTEISIRQNEATERYNSGLEMIRERARIKCDALLADDVTKEDAIFALNRKISDLLLSLEAQPEPQHVRPQSARGSRSNTISEHRFTPSSARSTSSRYNTRSTSKSYSKNPSSQISTKTSSKPSGFMSAMSSARSSTKVSYKSSAKSSARSSGNVSSRASSKNSSLSTPRRSGGSISKTETLSSVVRNRITEASTFTSDFV